MSNLKLHSLASGSAGNATLVQMNNTNILVDAGISCRRITEGLKKLDLTPDNLHAIVITHEHIDHVKGLRVWSKKNKTPIFAPENTWMNMQDRKEIDRVCCRILPKTLTIGDITIKPFNISHDAIEPMGFSFYCDQKKCSVVTDCGVVSPEIEEALAGSDLLMLEANHDIDMLRTGSYPLVLKKRIMSNHGHLSNLECAQLINRLIENKSMKIILAHLSEENNLPSLARKTVEDLLTNNDKHNYAEIKIAQPNSIVGFVL